MSTTTVPATNSRNELITSTIDKNVARNLTINRESGGTSFQNMGEVMEFAKLMAVSQQAVPPHCRQQVGICLGLAIQAIEWRMSPFAVAGKSYVVNDRIGYESQLIHAVIEQRAPIVSRLRHEFHGEGAKRKCKVWATARGESEPLEYTSPEFGTITPKNSPLWKSKPDLQLYYNTSRDWARIYFPDVILGVYSDDELGVIPAGHSAPTASGMEALKNRLLEQAKEVDGPEDNPADEQQQEREDESTIDADQSRDESGDGIDQPAGDDASQLPENPAGETPEERADREREQGKAKSRKQKTAFDNSEQYQ